MPTMTRFIKIETGEVMKRSVIDEEMRKDCGLPNDPERLCNLFMIVDWMAIIPRLRDESGKLSREKILAYCRDKDNEDGKQIYNEEFEIPMILKYMVEKYTIDAWYQPK